MGLSSSLVGVLAFVRRRTLLGESLSHATYPGVALTVALVAAPWVPLGALLSALVGFLIIERLKVSEDAALCLVLATFFGAGITVASYAQFTAPSAYRQIQMYLYGQAATMGDRQVLIYFLFTLLVMGAIALLYKEIQTVSFDRRFAQIAGLRVWLVDGVSFALLLLAVIGGIRTVGVVLMSAMLVAPPAAARQWTQSLSYMLLISGAVGAVSGLVGSLISIWTLIPTGPAIVLVASALCFASLLKVLIFRTTRMARFQIRCSQENALKALWKEGALPLPFWTGRTLCHQGWIERDDGCYHLTSDGKRRAERIVRLHRLWEVYLVDYLGVGAARVHKSAEEMEHIITPELERELTQLLRDPTEDPHRQPIPRGRL
jgi:manganese/zinc/iron transport system permease protein